MLGRNVGAERNFWAGVLPLFVKNMALPSIYARWNLTKATSGLSNLGLVRLPSPCEPFVERFDFVPTHPSCRGIAAGVVLAPCVLVYFVAQRVFLRGVQVAAGKG